MCAHAQPCPTLSNPMDCSLPGSSVHGISQARVLEWVAISTSRVFPNTDIELISAVALVLESGFFTTETLGKPDSHYAPEYMLHDVK